MTESNHSEEISKEIETLFKKAHRIERLGAEAIFYGSTRGDDFKRDRLKDIISGKYRRRRKAGDASDKLSKILAQLEMLGDLISVAGDTLIDDTLPSAGTAIWQLADEGKKALTILSDRWSDLEHGGAS